MNSVVLDASALLAVIGNERGSEVVIPILSVSVISAVNYSEVIKRLTETSRDSNAAREHVARLMVRIEPFTESHGRRTAEFWPVSKEFGLSLADRACLALGSMMGVEVLTADKRIFDADTGVHVRLIREHH